MAKVTGIGGVFFKANDPKALAQWYAKHLGVSIEGPDEETNGLFAWVLDPEGNKVELWEPRDPA